MTCSCGHDKVFHSGGGCTFAEGQPPHKACDCTAFDGPTLRALPDPPAEVDWKAYATTLVHLQAAEVHANNAAREAALATQAYDLARETLTKVVAA